MAVAGERLGAVGTGTVPVALRRLTARRFGAWVAAAGWGSMVAMWVTGNAGAFGHDQQGIPPLAGAGFFLLGWIAMVAGMMLPSSLATLGRIDRAPLVRPGMPAVGVVAGYVFVWSAFGALAYAGDGILHRLAEMPALAARPSLIAGASAVLAGAAELLGRTPPPALPRIAAGTGAFSVGATHGVERIRRCWPLMLFAMAVGMESPAWMVGLTLLMMLELSPRASASLRFAGAVLVALGVAVIVEPAWLPLLSGASR